MTQERRIPYLFSQVRDIDEGTPLEPITFLHTFAFQPCAKCGQDADEYGGIVNGHQVCSVCLGLPGRERDRNYA